MYKVEINHCNCHPETCACNDYKVIDENGKKVSSHFHRDAAENLCNVINGIIKAENELSTRIGQAVLELTSDGLDIIEIFWDSSIKCCGHFTDFEYVFFRGDSLIECLEKAVEEKRKFNEKV